jgi:hypothetical protein
MRQNKNGLFHSNRSKELFSLQNSLRNFGPKSNLDVPDEIHTKGLMTESKKLNFKRWINLPQIASHSTLHNILYQSLNLIHKQTSLHRLSKIDQHL